MSSVPCLSIVIPSYERKEKLLRCLSSILPQINGQIELVIIDNASPTPIASFVDQSHLRIIRNELNIGFVGNFLRAFEVAKADWIWIVGDDDEVRADGVSTVISHILKHPGVGHIFFQLYGSNKGDKNYKWG